MSRITGALAEFFRSGDLLLLGLCLASNCFGLALIYSATRWNGDNRSILIQAICMGLGVVVYMVLTFVDIELFVERTWKWLLGANILLIMALLTPFGVDGGTGNLNWLAFPGIPFNIQPSEVAKIFFILLLAYQCVKYRERGVSRPAAVFGLVAHTGLMAGLIVGISGDFGMALVYLALFILLAWTAGVAIRWFLLGGAAAAGVSAVVWPRLPDYIQRRILVVFDHALDPQGAGWQQNRSILAIGSGGVTGQGYLRGIQSQSPYESSLPARWTDEIFAVCGEELGLVGCLALLALLTAIVLRCIYVGRTAHSPVCALAAVGYAGMLLVQICINVGTCLYVFPVVGLTLPFISYGGSSLLMLYAAMGIVSGIKARSLPSWLRDRNQA